MKLYLLPRAVFVFFLLAATLLLVSSAFAAPLEQSNSCVNAPVAGDPTPTVCVTRVTAAMDDTSEENQFYVSWRSQKAEVGKVQVVGGDTFNDVRGANISSKTHYVQVNNLDANSTVAFDIVSGNKTYNDGGAHFSAKLFAAVQSATPYIIFGHVQNPDGSDADGALVYAQIRHRGNQGTGGRSAYLSAIIVVADGGNLFNINLDDARTQNNGQKFTFDPDTDRVFITVVGAQGTASQAFSISDLHPPADPPTLILGNGTGTVVTATPTLVEPSATPTVPSPTPTLTSTPTATFTAIPPTAIVIPPTETAVSVPTFENVEPTVTAQAATPAATAIVTSVALPAEGEGEIETPTRVSFGVPTFVTAPETNSGLVIIVLAVVLIVGAALLGLAAFFVTRR